MTNFPNKQLWIMAILDTIYFAGLIISASSVSPTMTVILLHASTPFVVLGSRKIFPNRKYSEIQMKGVFYISFALLISISRPIYNSIGEKNKDYSEAYSIFFYILSAATQGFASLYKEKCIIEWSQPIDIHYLSSWLFTYQFIFAIIISPLLYLTQGLSDNFTGFPLSSFFENLNEGWICGIHSTNPSNHNHFDISYSSCSYSLLVILGFVISNLVVLECIDTVLQTSNQILGR
jgi:hypothetical protein